MAIKLWVPLNFKHVTTCLLLINVTKTRRNQLQSINNSTTTTTTTTTTESNKDGGAEISVTSSEKPVLLSVLKPDLPVEKPVLEKETESSLQE